MVEARREVRILRLTLTAAAIVVLAAGVSACEYATPAPPTTTTTATKTSGGTQAVHADSPRPPTVTGSRVTDSFGNVDYYTTVSGDTVASLSDAFKLPAARIAGFNGLSHDARLTPGVKLRLIPMPGPLAGARGTETDDANGIPLTYVVAAGDGIEGIGYRFGLSREQLDEANMWTDDQHSGVPAYLHPGNTIQLQKRPVDPRSGTGKTINNSVGDPDYYTTVDGDRVDSLGYKFRRPTDQLLRYNPDLKTGSPIPAGTRIRLAPLDLPIDGARGTFTTSPDGIPVTYTTAPGDTDEQIANRFNLNYQSLLKANPGPQSVSYTYVQNHTLAPAQTISLDITNPSIGSPSA